MIDTLSVHFLNGYTYIRKHPQLLMTLLLVVVIPVAFLVSGQQFLSAARDNQERLEKDRIGILHDVFASFLVGSNFDFVLIEEQILSITSHNPDIEIFDVAKEEGAELVTIASNIPDSAGTSIENPHAYRIGNTNPNESIIVPTIERGQRYWESYRLVSTPSGDDYYIHTKTSLVHIDALFAQRVATAYYWLFAIMGIVLILIVRHVRLVDYAYLYRETKQANETKDLFTNMIAHELRAPLTAIRGYASMIREDSTATPGVRNDAKRIELASIRLVHIVSDLLDIARIRAGKLSVHSERTDVLEVVASVIAEIQSSAHEKAITLAQDGVKESLYIMVDKSRLHQALTNLVSNSIKYSPKGTITISLDARADRIEIRVKDTGTGISAENQKHLFAPFFRVENTETDSVAGTGLGMWITKQLIELMKGSIAVESIRSVGTHIVITLPK